MVRRRERERERGRVCGRKNKKETTTEMVVFFRRVGVK